MSHKDHFQYAQTNKKKRTRGLKNTTTTLKCPNYQKPPLKLDQDKATDR